MTKMKTKAEILLIVVICTISFTSMGQSYKKSDLGIVAEINAMKVEIQFYSPSAVRILKWPAGISFSKESLSVINTGKQGTSCNTEPEKRKDYIQKPG